MDKNEIYCQIEHEPIVSTHSHHLPDKDQAALGLFTVLKNSYVNWCGKPIPSGDNSDEVTAWLDTVHSRSYFVWLEKALMELYGIREPLCAGNWSEYDSAIQNAHQDRDWHLHVLHKHCHYDAVILDTFWNPGDDNGHPELFHPAYRVNSMLYGYNRRDRDHDDFNFQVLSNTDIHDIDEYIRFVDDKLCEMKRTGHTVIKCAIAYCRSLNFPIVSKAQAQKAMCDSPDATDIEAFQSYVFDHICQIAAHIQMPVQIHTGLGLMRGSRAMELQSLIERHHETTFWLMHGSYPWTSDIAGLCHAYPHVWADLCWLPIISPTAAHRFMHELMDVCTSDRIVWGCDTLTSEESYGARLAFLDVLSRVLSERVESGMIRECDALRYAKAIMHDNAARITGGV